MGPFPFLPLTLFLLPVFPFPFLPSFLSFSFPALFPFFQFFFLLHFFPLHFFFPFFGLVFFFPASADLTSLDIDASLDSSAELCKKKRRRTMENGTKTAFILLSK